MGNSVGNYIIIAFILHGIVAYVVKTVMRPLTTYISYLAILMFSSCSDSCAE